MFRFTFVALAWAWAILLVQLWPADEAVADGLPGPPAPMALGPVAAAPKPASTSARRGWVEPSAAPDARPAAPPRPAPPSRLISGDAISASSRPLGPAAPPASVGPIVNAASTATAAPAVTEALPPALPAGVPQSRLVGHAAAALQQPLSVAGLQPPPAAPAAQSPPPETTRVSLQRMVQPDVAQPIEQLPPPVEAPPAEAPTSSARRPRPLEDKPLSAVQFRLAPKPGELPDDVAQARFGREPMILDGSILSRRPVDLNYSWDAPALCYGPIYIQDVNLERYGYSHGIFQAGYSAVHFLGSVAILPYLWGAYPQRNCYYALGYYRPGDYAPYQKSVPRVSLRGVLFEGGVGAAAAFGIPGFIP